MTVDSLRELTQSEFDIVICGGGLAGLTLARQLRRSHPALSILVAERTTRPLPDAAHKVGESSVELGSRYLEQIGLRDYLVEHHLFKFGLRFFPGGGQRPLEQRSELGPAREPIVPSYQIDRGRFENDLRGMLVEDGVTLVEGVKASVVLLAPGEDLHEVELRPVRNPRASAVESNEPEPTEAETGSRRIRCRWLIDATGRAALLRKRMKLTRGTRHPANASWFRVGGVVDITKLVPESERSWHDVEWAPHRWRSTNHLMGPGYWAWIIPLSSGNTSIGVVVHDEHYGFDEIRTLDRTRAFLREHEPVLARALGDESAGQIDGETGEYTEDHPVLDFGALRSYSHNVARSWSADRWAIVGEAGAFVDPLYSPGTDFIAFTNSFTEEMIRCDLEGGDLETRARELSALYRSIVSGGVDLYRDAADIYGHADALLAKVYWDNLAYWSYPCQFFIQELYRQTGPALAEIVPVGQRYSQLTLHLQQLFAAWAKLSPCEPKPGFRGMPGFPSVLIDAHLALQDEMTPDETLAYMKSRLVESEEIAGEILLRVMDEVGPDKVDALLDQAKVRDWGIVVSDERVAAFDTIGIARRRALRPLARDVERTLGRTPHNLDEATVRRVLGPMVAPAPNADQSFEPLPEKAGAAT